MSLSSLEFSLRGHCTTHFPSSRVNTSSRKVGPSGERIGTTEGPRATLSGAHSSSACAVMIPDTLPTCGNLAKAIVALNCLMNSPTALSVNDFSRTRYR